MYPAPITTRCSGIFFGASAPVDDHTLSSSKAKPGIAIGTEPVAITKSSASSVFAPSFVFTWTCLLSTKLADPITTCTL